MSVPSTALRLALLLLGLALPARAQVDRPEQDGGVARLQLEFDYGKFPEVLAQAEVRLDRGGLSDEARVELHRLAGLAAFNVDRREVAERHFRSALRLEPDLALDPFRVPSSAITFFGRLRDQMTGELETLRREKAERLERARRETELRALERSEVESLRRRVDELSRQVTVRTVEKPSYLVNFLPFGTGQFQQGRSGLGIALAASQGALAATSILAYVTRGTLRKAETEVVYGRVGEDEFRRIIWRVPPERQREEEAWKLVQYSSALGFYGAYLFGVVDALLQHRDMVVSTALEPPAPAPPQAHLSLQPLPGGASAGLTLRF